MLARFIKDAPFDGACALLLRACIRALRCV
jgi:hypothetical protein